MTMFEVFPAENELGVCHQADAINACHQVDAITNEVLKAGNKKQGRLVRVHKHVECKAMSAKELIRVGVGRVGDSALTLSRPLKSTVEGWRHSSNLPRGCRRLTEPTGAVVSMAVLGSAWFCRV